MNEQPVIEVKDLVLEYGKGRARVRAVDGISFTVSQGECVGFIGANGAGKSTTIKSLLGFMFPTSGAVRVFGLPPGTSRSRARIGYLPEVALYYPFMKARELLELYGGLHGISGRELRARIPALLDKVGLGGNGEALLRHFSKGMQQRLGIAQALISNPEALIFDELSSGLDPLGRHDLRGVLLDLKKAGRTIFFSSHELTEVESLCDRVVIIHKGKLLITARIVDLLEPLNRFEIVFRTGGAGDGMPDAVRELGVEESGGDCRLAVNDASTYAMALQNLTAANCVILKTSSKSRSLEDYFIEMARGRETRV